MKDATQVYHGYRFPPAIISHAVWLYHRVHGELMLKLLREAGAALGSESANGSYSMRFAVWDYLQLPSRSRMSFLASRALAKVEPTRNGGISRYHPGDQLLLFLNAL